MDWQDNEFEGFLKRFRLREPRDLPIAQETRAARNHRAHLTKIAAAAVLVIAIGASAAIVQQYAEEPDPIMQEPLIVRHDQAGPAVLLPPVPPPPPIAPQPPAIPEVKPDPKPPEPLKQLTKVIPPLPEVPGPTPLPVATPEPINITVEAACLGCHGMDVVGALKSADREAYRAMVEKMISYGASVPADQVGPLVDYLFGTYGNRPRPRP